MRTSLFILLCMLCLYSCVSSPPNFSYRYENRNTGLDKLIDINGYYVSQQECDSAFFSMYMFYPNGLFSIATTSGISPELVDCFEKGGKSKLCQYPIWGTYRLEGNLIKTQALRMEGGGCVIFRDYRILANKTIANLSDYVQPQHTVMGYMTNYPSFETNPCEKLALFYPLTTKRDSTECPFLNKKWFKNY